MKMYNIGIGDFFIRFYLLIIFIVVMGFAGFLYVGIVMGMILFLTTIIGLQFKKGSDVQAISEEVDHHVWFNNVHIPRRRYNIWHKRHHWATH